MRGAVAVGNEKHVHLFGGEQVLRSDHALSGLRN